MMALDALIEEHHDAIAYDLIALGLRLRDLGTKKLMWGDLRAIVRQAPRSSALYRALNPEESEWGLPEQLQAYMVDLLNILAWQNSGGKSKDRPEPITRPGVEPSNKQFGNDAIGLDDMAEFLGWKAEPA